MPEECEVKKMCDELENKVLLVCNVCGYEDDYDKGYADEETFPNGLECCFCKDGRLKPFVKED